MRRSESCAAIAPRTCFRRGPRARTELMKSTEAIHLGQVPDEAVLDSLADFICGDDSSKYPIYRSSSYLTKFFTSVGIQAQHDGSTRKWWVLEVLKQLQAHQIEAVILKLVDFKLYKGDINSFRLAVQSMNSILLMENFEIGVDGTTPYIRRGRGITFTDEDFKPLNSESEGEAEFLKQQFPETVQIAELNLDAGLSDVLQSRIEEVRACPKELAPLAIVFLLGSALEGLLLAVALDKPTEFTASTSAPKDKQGVAIPLHKWKLSDLINVGHDIGLLDLDVKKYSHGLRDFRNFIHPYEQRANGFNPDLHTVEISWQVFLAAFQQVKRNRHKLN